jgi:hypothetical protein
MKVKLLLLPLFASVVFSSGRAGAPAISLIRTPGGGIQPEAVMDGAGTLHLLYYKGDAMHGDLFYARSNDLGAAWSQPLRVNSEPGTAIAAGTIRGGQIAIGRKGRVHVAWNGSSQAQATGPVNPESGKRESPMLYSRLNDAGTAFEAERSVMTHTFGLDGGGTVAADSAGNVYVSWHGKAAGAPAGEMGRQVWVAESHDDGKTFSAERPAWKDATGACGCCGLAMFADDEGILRLMYRSATDSIHRDIYLLTSRDHGRTFQGRKVDPWEINACPMSSMAFAEGGGAVEGAWETRGQVYFEDFSESGAGRVGAPGAAKSRRHPRIAVGPKGRTLMIWTEGTGWARGGSLAWQLYDGGDKPTGEEGMQAGVPAWSFGAVVAAGKKFVVIY